MKITLVRKKTKGIIIIMIMKITEEKGNAKLRGSQSSLVGSLGRLLGRHTPALKVRRKEGSGYQ